MPIYLLAGALLICTNVFGSALCDKLLEALARADSLVRYYQKEGMGGDPWHQRVPLLVDKIVELAEQRARSSGPPRDGYAAQIGSLGKQGQSIHSHRPQAPVGDDARVLLELPSPGQPTVWQALSDVEREKLLSRLEEVFRYGKYDQAIANESNYEAPGGPYTALRDAAVAIGNWKKSYYDSFLPKEAAHTGFVPLLLLGAARKFLKTGICRQGACAYAGFLGELGVPASDVRLVTGYSRKTSDGRVEDGHFWVEVRDSKGIWRAYNPTADSDHIWNMRERFPYHQQEFTGFFEPVLTSPGPR